MRQAGFFVAVLSRDDAFGALGEMETIIWREV